MERIYCIAQLPNYRLYTEDTKNENGSRLLGKKGGAKKAVKEK